MMPPRNDTLKGAYISWSTKEDDAIRRWEKMMPPRNDTLKGAYISWSTKEDDAIGKIKYSKLSDDGFTFVAELDLDSIITFPKEKMMDKNEELKNVDKIVITRNGNTVSADAYDRTGRFIDVICHRATATCGPNDIFDFNIGAKLAFDRLYEGYDMTPKPKRKPYNGLIYIHEYPGCGLAERAVYKVVDGYIANCGYAPKEPYIFEDMNDSDLSEEIKEHLYGGIYRVIAYFVRNDKTKA